jgi:AcrR family transcriptional regulator
MKYIHVNYVKSFHVLQLIIDSFSHFAHNRGMDEQVLRRTPQQARSQQRVEEILQAASDILVEEGYESLTTSAIAQRAGISVGSLFQFFANKEAVLQALGQRYLEKLAMFNENVFTPDAIYVPIPILFERTVDTLAEFVDKNRGLNQLFSAPWLSPDLQAVSDASTNQMILEVQKILKGKAPHLTDEETYVAAQALMHMIRGMLPLVETAVSEQRAAIIAEFKRMGTAYLTAVTE